MMLNKLIPEVCHSGFTGLSLMPSVDNEYTVWKGRQLCSLPFFSPFPYWSSNSYSIVPQEAQDMGEDCNENLETKKDSGRKYFTVEYDYLPFETMRYISISKHEGKVRDSVPSYQLITSINTRS